MITLAIDRFGRIVIPKDIRDRHGWGPGTEIILHDDAESVHLQSATPVASGRGLVIRDGGLVYDAAWQPRNPGDSDPIRAALEASRIERDAALGGMPNGENL